MNLDARYHHHILQLREEWKEIGYSTHEQTHYENTFFQELHHVFTRQLESTKTRKLEIQHENQHLQEQLEHQSKQLDISNTFNPTHYQTYPTLLQQQDYLTTLLHTQQQIYDKRKDQALELQEQLERISAKLGHPLSNEYQDLSNFLTFEKMKVLETEIHKQERELENRQRAIAKVVGECAFVLESLQLAPAELTKLDIAILHEQNQDWDCSMAGIEALSTRASELSQLKQQRELTLHSLGQQITALWEKLKISQNVQDEFFEGVTGIGMDAIEACKEELQRLQELKQERLADLIQECRARITLVLEESGCPGTLRLQVDQVLARGEEDFSDHLLEEHEEQLKLLEKHQQNLGLISNLIAKREAILSDRADYERSLLDPERLLKRGRDPGRLLREEKLQTRIKKDLPKITELVKTRISNYEKAYETGFLYEGENYFNTMERQDTEYERQKQEQKLEKERRKQLEKEHELKWGSTPRRQPDKKLSKIKSDMKGRPSLSKDRVSLTPKASKVRPERLSSGSGSSAGESTG